MYCSNCGKPLSSGQGFCPYCGSKVGANGQNNGINLNLNVNEPSDSIGFNRNMEEDLNQFASNNPYEQRNPVIQNGGMGNQANNTIPVGMRMPISNKKKFPWILLAVILLIIMIVGVVFSPVVNELKMNTYEDELYTLQYNSNWTLDTSEEDLFLYYSDNSSKFIFNAISSFKELEFEIEDEEDKKLLYKAFYEAWSDVDEIELDGGTETFLTLEDGSIYTKVDYKMIADGNVGSFYVVINEKYDVVISFMSYCSVSNRETIEAEALEIINRISYKGKIETE